MEIVMKGGIITMTTNQINYFKAKLDEAHYARSDAEQARHNYAVEQISREQNEEIKRANLAKEAELHRSNVASETNYYANLIENSRHNRVTETLSGDSVNIQRERAMYQNLLDTANVANVQARTANVQADTTLLGFKSEGQSIANKQQNLNYNLDTNYAEIERLTAPISNVSVAGVNIGGIGKSLATIITSLSNSKSNKNSAKKEYYSLIK